MFDILSAGHFSIDNIYLPQKSVPYIILGGSAAYVSLTAQVLGAKTSVISKVGSDFPEAYLWWLRQEGVDLSGVIRVEEAKSTRFELKYLSDFSSREMRVKFIAPPITIEDLPKSIESKAVHIAPIAGEISTEVVESLRGCAEFLSLDPQGLIRVFDENGNVKNGQLEDKRVLELINIYKSSEAEIKAATGKDDLTSAIKAVHDLGVETVIVTLGAKGAMLSVEGTAYIIPSYSNAKVVDPTGAGDVFIGGFLAEYVSGKDSLWCACVGSSAASIAIEAVGPTFPRDKTEIYRRANVLYGKEIKS
ncbi:MAG: PfkB family carbohydrate kinase [Candidatus Bathyarchaeia archaeon]